MILLGIDTSSEWVSLAFGKSKDLILSRTLFAPKKHVVILHSLINEVLEKANKDINDVDLFVVVKGPGSFTGIRIAVTAIKGFVYALNKKCVSLISLDLLAQNAINDKRDLILPIIDARRGQVYTALYKKENKKLLRVSDYQLIKIEEALAKLDCSCILLGNGVRAYQEIIAAYKKKKEIMILREELWQIKCEHIIKLGYEKYKNEGAENIFDLKPFYIYPKECTITKS